MIEAEISEASLADADEISALAIATYVDTFGHEFEPDELAYHLERSISPARWRNYLARDRVFVARLHGRPIGFVQFGPGPTPGEFIIERLYVVRELQGKGLGSDLLRRALDALTGNVIRIDVWESNHAARRLYERFGFRHEGGREPFILKSGQIDGYDLILVRRPEGLTGAQPQADRVAP